MARIMIGPARESLRAGSLLHPFRTFNLYFHILCSNTGTDATSKFREFSRLKLKEIQNLSLHFYNYLSSPSSAREGIYLDRKSRYCFYLSRSRNTESPLPPLYLAVLGFDFLPGFDIIITQLQGRKSKNRERKPSLPREWEALPSGWERGLVRTLAGWASEIGIRKIKMTKPEDIEWYSHPAHIPLFEREAIQKHQERMKRRYNGTAGKLGFRRDKKGSLVLSL